MGDEGAEGHKGAEGAEEDEWAEEDEGGEVAEGADGIDVAAIYILLEHHGNRHFGVMELLSKMSDCTMGDCIPLKLLRLLQHLRCRK